MSLTGLGGPGPWWTPVRAFAPTAAEIERAKALVNAFHGGAERFGDEMIERMHVEAAQRVLERAKTSS